MTEKQTSEVSIQLDSICKDYSNYNTKIASLTLLKSSNYSHASEAFLLIIEYLQIISQALLLNHTLYDNLDTSGTNLSTGVIYCAKLLNPGFWLLLEDYRILTLVILICLILFTVLKYVVILLIVRNVYKNARNPGWLLYFLRGLYRSQARVICYFVTSVWVHLIWMTRQGQFKTLEIGQNVIIPVGGVMIAMEYILSFSLQFRCCYVLPTKSLLSSKDNDLEITTLAQKLIIQILQMALPINASGTEWTFTIINLLSSLLRERLFCSNLPFYKFKALQYQERLLAIVTALNIACFMQNMLSSLKYNSNISFIVFTWILLTILIGKFSREYLNKTILNFNNKNKVESSKLAIHRILALKHWRSLKMEPSESAQRYELSYIINNSVSINLEDILNLTPQFKADNELNFSSRQSVNKMFTHYLESLSHRFPKDEFLKLYIAYFYTKKLKQYGIGMKIIMELQKSSTYKIASSASLLIHEIEKAVERDYKDHFLDLHSYVKNQSKNAELKKKMFDLISKYRDLYNEVLKESSDLEKIFQLTQKIGKRKRNIESDMRLLLNTTTDNNIRPLMVYSLYHLSLGHSVSDYLQYQRNYNLKFEKYSKFFKNDKLVEENLYQDKNIFMILSGQKPDVGKIIYSTRNIQDAYGGEVQLYLGANISTLSPSCLRSFYEQTAAELGETFNLGVPSRNFCYHKEGYLVESDFYVNVHPYMTSGFYLDVILRPVPTMKDCIMLDENGNIEGVTRNIAKTLGLSNYKTMNLNIKELSQELWEINEAFNLIHSEKLFDKSQMPKHIQSEGKDIDALFENTNESMGLTETEAKLNRAQEIYSLFTTTGKDIQISPLLNGKSDAIYTYRCLVTKKVYGSLLLKYVTLEKVSQEVITIKDLGFKNINYQESLQIETKLEDSCDLQFEDEKQGGWINLKSLEAGQSEIALAISKPFETNEEPLNYPLNPTETNMAKALLLNHQQNRVQSYPLFKESSETPKIRNEKVMLTSNREKRLLVANASTGSQLSKKSQEKRVSNAFRFALGVKYTPYSIRIIAVIYYGLLLAIFGTQVSNKKIIDTAISNLKIGRDFTSLAENLNYCLANIMFTTRLTSDLASGKLDGGELIASEYANSIQIYGESLSIINKQLMASASLIDGKREFFTSSVKVYNPDLSNSVINFTSLNSFQAVDRIVETSFKVVKGFKAKDANKIQDQVAFIFENAVNDIYVANQGISDGFASFIENERQGIDTTINVYLICTVVIGATVNIMLTFVMIKAYLKEKLYLTAVATLSVKGIRKALEKVNYFQKVLESETAMNFQENGESIILLKDEYDNRHLLKNKVHKNLKVPNYKGLRRKYIFRITRVWLSGCVIVGMTIGYCFLGVISLQFFQIKQSQLYFTYRLGSHASLVGVASQELLASNGTTPIKNQLSADIIGGLISSLTEMKNRISNVYMKKDFTYDPLIQTMLFYNACSILDPTQVLTFCSNIEALGKQSGLLYVVGDLEAMAEDNKNKFEISDKSKDSLDQIQFENTGILVTDYFVIVQECAAIGKLISAEFDSEFSTATKQRTELFIVYTLLLIFMGYLVWIIILKRLVNVISDVKVVLQAFPATLVLSSFMLKMFLMKTSRGALDIIKNSV